MWSSFAARVASSRAMRSHSPTEVAKTDTSSQSFCSWESQLHRQGRIGSLVRLFGVLRSATCLKLRQSSRSAPSGASRHELTRRNTHVRARRKKQSKHLPRPGCEQASRTLRTRSFASTAPTTIGCTSKHSSSVVGYAGFTTRHLSEREDTVVATRPGVAIDRPGTQTSGNRDRELCERVI